MTNASKHIIEKFHLEFKTPSENNGKELERQSIEMLKHKLLPKMETVFDRFGEGRNLRLSKLSFEINTLDPIRFEEQFINQFLKQLSQKLENVQQNQKSEFTQQNNSELVEKDLDLFAYFLENGHFPWWAQVKSVAALEEKILREKRILSSITTILGNDPEKLKRLVYQFSDAFLKTIMDWYVDKIPDLKDLIGDVKRKLSKSHVSSEERNQLCLSVFKAIFLKKEPFEKAKDDNLLDLKSEEAFAKTKSKSEHQLDKKPGQKEWYVNNAGLVLLHPFLVLFFEGSGLTKEKKFKDLHAKNQAVLLLQYLATGQIQTFEHELILNKILCDIPLLMPIEKDLVLNDKIKAEAEQLLNAAIKHWSALKNTSPDGLRNTFLQREGKLTKNENGDWKLIIQQTGLDILISKLPWSISIIKLPWMKNRLQVDWA